MACLGAERFNNYYLVPVGVSLGVGVEHVGQHEALSGYRRRHRRDGQRLLVGRLDDAFIFFTALLIMRATGGFAYRFAPQYQLDYAASGQVLGVTHRIGLAFRFGGFFAASRAEPEAFATAARPQSLRTGRQSRQPQPPSILPATAGRAQASR